MTLLSRSPALHCQPLEEMGKGNVYFTAGVLSTELETFVTGDGAGEVVALSFVFLLAFQVHYVL